MNEDGITILAGVSVAILAYLLVDKAQKEKEKLKEDNMVDVSDGDDLLKRTAEKLPSLAAGLDQKWSLGQVKESHPWIKLKNKLEQQTLRAGNPKNLSANNMVDLTFYSSIFCALFGYLYAESLSLAPIISCYLGFGFGAFIPYGLLNVAVGRRQTEIRKELPYLLDLLTLCVESGMDFTTALIRIGPTFKDTPLGAEVALMVTEMRMGKSRQDSLRDLSQRVGIVELSTVVNAIIQSDKLGASMGPSLRIQSEDMRKRRILLAEEAGMKAPVKLLFPLVMFIFPTTFIILFAPMLIKLL